MQSSFRTGSRRFRFDQVFYRNKVRKLVFANIKKRTKKTNGIFTTKLFSVKKLIFHSSSRTAHARIRSTDTAKETMKFLRERTLVLIHPGRLTART